MNDWTFGYQDTFHSVASSQADKDRLVLNLEQSGQADGLITRFLPKELHPKFLEEKRRKEQATLSLLEYLLLTDPAYAKLYAETLDLLNQAEQDTANAIAEAEYRYKDIMENAARLPDGRAVFMDQEGNVWDENGNTIDPDIAEGIVWPDDAPTYENYVQTVQRLNDLRHYQVEVLGRARERLEDRNDPPRTIDDINDINRGIQDGLDNIVRAGAADFQNVSSTMQLSRGEMVPDFMY